MPTRLLETFRALALIGLLLGLPRPAAGQDSLPAPIGSRVRLTLRADPEKRRVGDLMQVERDSLTLLVRSGKHLEQFRRADLERIEVAVRKPEIWRGFALGAVAGGALAGVVALFAASKPSCGQGQSSGFFCFDGSGGAIAKVVAMGVAAGGAAGVEMALTNPRDRWHAGRLDGPASRSGAASLRLAVGRLDAFAVVSLGLRLRL